MPSNFLFIIFSIELIELFIFFLLNHSSLIRLALIGKIGHVGVKLIQMHL